MDADIENDPEEYNIPVPKMETNEHEGWSLFYRASQPEKVTWPQYAKRIQTKLKSFGPHQKQLPEKTIVKTALQRQLASDRIANKRTMKGFLKQDPLMVMKKQRS